MQKQSDRGTDAKIFHFVFIYPCPSGVYPWLKISAPLPPGVFALKPSAAPVMGKPQENNCLLAGELRKRKTLHLMRRFVLLLEIRNQDCRMKNLIRSLLVGAVCVLVSNQARAAIVASYNFNGSSLASSDTEPVTTAGSVSLTGSDLSLVTSAPSIGNPLPAIKIDKNIGTAQNVSQYIQFTLTATAGNQFSLQNLTFDLANSGNNKTANWAVSSSFNNFATSIGSGTIVGNSFVNESVNLSGLGNLTTITFRVYGWDTDQVDLFFDNIVLNSSSISAVPEPMNAALAAFGLIFIGGGVGRFYFRRAQRAVAA
jgi:hypothetical protein